jgi:hypothetical protein
MAGSGPSVLIFENWDDLEKYCDARVFAGDVIDVWQFAETCRPDTRLAENESGGMPVPLIRQTLERTGPVVVEHRARQAVAPERLSFDDAEEFQEYWDSHVRPDDDISVWSYSHVCSLELRVAWGVCPDPDGRTPLQGAY